MVSTPDWVTRELRATRAAPQEKLPKMSSAALIYNAALQQFEELLDAARAVGPASRPIPLYYALNQASRAIVAARGDVTSIDGHGLSQYRYRAEGESPPAELLHCRFKGCW